LNLPTLDPSRVNIPESAWELVEITEDFVRHRAPLERLPNGQVVYVQRTTPRAVAALLENNKRLLNESDGQRFGDGKVVGRIPLNVLYRDVAPRLKEGDRDFLPWFLDRDENRPFRTFRGRLK
jgi:hypothetical protein